jgi:hypothetical protein
MRLTITAAGEPALFKHAPCGPSLRSKRGIEQFRRTNDTCARPISRRGAPMSPTGAAITLEALSTGLRQCQSLSTNPVTVGLAGRCRPVTAGTSYRSPPDVSGRLGSQPRLRIPQGERRTRELRNTVGVRAHFRSVSAPRRRSQSDRSPRHARRSNKFHLGTCLSRTRLPILQLAVVTSHAAPKTACAN